MYDKTEGIIREFMDEGRLSRRKLKHLQEVHERTMDQVFAGQLISPHVAPSELCEGTRLPTGAYWIEVVARVLDMDALFKWQEDCHAKGVEPVQAVGNFAPRWADLVAEAAEYLDLWDEDYLDREWWKLHQLPGATDADYEAHLKQDEEEREAKRQAINSI
jgi:hypothetical protein